MRSARIDQDQLIREGLETKYFGHLSVRPPSELLDRLWEAAVEDTFEWCTSRREEIEGYKKHYRFLAELVLWPERLDD